MMGRLLAFLPGADLASPWLMVAGLLAVYASLLLVVLSVVSASRPRIDLHLLGVPRSAARTPIGGRGEWIVRAIESLLHRGQRLDDLAMKLEMAGVRLRPGDFVVLVFAGALAGAATGIAIGGPLFAVILVVSTPVVAKLLLSMKTDRRQAAFADQLDVTLQLLSGSIRAGHSLLQAVDAVAREAEEPTSVEFRRIVNVTRVGQDLSDALSVAVERTASDDFSWVAQAIAIHREVGGNLGEVLDTVAHTIRDRNQLRRQVQALSAEGKLSAVVLMALPVGVVGFLAVANPEYLSAFTESLAGWTMAATATAMMLLGGAWLLKLTHIKF